MHRVFFDADLPDVGDPLVIEGEEAHHALRVKRVRPGDVLQILNGRGDIGVARVIEHPGPHAGSSSPRRHARPDTLSAVIEQRTHHAPLNPRLEVCSAVPKGARADDLVDHLAQVGAALWRPLSTRHGVVDPGSVRLDRLSRIAREAAKQSGRPWLMEVDAAISLDRSVQAADPGHGRIALVVAHPGAPAYRSCGAGTVRLLIGPEAGFTPDEVELMVSAGAIAAEFGPHIMRIETAAVAAAAIVLNAERSSKTGSTVPPHTGC